MVVLHLTGVRWICARVALIGGLLAAPLTGVSQGTVGAQEKGFDEKSLAWRTALHFDPTAEAPLDLLVDLYAGDGRLGELVNLYLNHLQAYPEDAAATLVLGRIYVRSEDSRAGRFLEDARNRFPKQADLTWLWGGWLGKRHQPGGKEARMKAILLTEDVGRRDVWVGEVIESITLSGGAEIVAEGLRRLCEKEDVTPEERLRWAGQALAVGQASMASVLGQGISLEVFSGDAWIEAALTRCRTLLALEDFKRAREQADEILAKLAADHWRWPEVVRLRWQCADSSEEREALVQGSAERLKKDPQNGTEILRHVEMLRIANRVPEAIELLEGSVEDRPNARGLEKRLLDLYQSERMDEGALGFLGQQLEADPERWDLARLRARWLLELGRIEEGLKQLSEVTGRLSRGESLEEILGTSRWLRRRNLLAEAAAVLEAGLEDNAGLWSLRKELGELLATLRRTDELAALFEVAVPESTPLEERMETAMFLVGHGLWEAARRCLEGWVDSHPAEFEGRLLMARICVLMGDIGTGERLLVEARERADTVERYAGWLAAAHGLAEESGEEGFLEEERARLQPADGDWKTRDLARLVQLGSYATEASAFVEAEQLLRDAMEVPTVTPEERRDLTHQLVRLLDGQADRAGDQEKLIRELLSESDEGSQDLRLRLVLLYERSGRADLMDAELRQLDVEGCDNVTLLIQASSMLQQRPERRTLAKMADRLVRLPCGRGCRN
jgi:hypothetical protein